MEEFMKSIMRTLLCVVALACLLCVCVAAANYDYAHVKEFVDESRYADITFANGWVQVSTGAAASRKDADGDGKFVKEGDLPSGSGYKAAYFNETTKTLVIEGKDIYSSPTANSGDYQNKNGDKNHLFPYWCNLNADKVEHIEFRAIYAFNNTGYIIRPLKNVKTIKLDVTASTYNASKDDTALLGGLTSLTTAGFGSWDANGKWTPSEYYKTGVIDLRGFTTIRVTATTTTSVPDLLLFMNYAIAGATSATEVILPEKLTTKPDSAYNVIVVSDGTDKFPLYDGSGSVTKNKAAYKIKNKTTGEVAYTTNWQIPDGWSNVTAKAVDISPYFGEFSGTIPYAFAQNATSLKCVTVPAGVNLFRIYKNAFVGCSSLEDVRILGTVDESFTIDAGAFGTGSSTLKGVEIHVQTLEDTVIVYNALQKAGYTDKTKVRVVCDKTPVSADGFQVKINADYSGLRGLFSFDEGSKDIYGLLGYEFVEYGVIVCTKSTAGTLTYDEIFASDNNKIKKIVIEKADGTGVNRYVDYEKRQFCIALTGIPDVNSMDDVLFVAYSRWFSDEGVENVYTEYKAADGEPYVNLYEVTLGLMKNGLLNSETVQAAGGDVDTVIWNPLKKGAVTIAADGLAAPGTPQNSSSKEKYTLHVDAQYNEDGSFTYLDNPLYAFTGATSGNYSFNPTGVEKTSTTNVLWSLYHDNGEFVAVYRRDPAAKADAVAFLPTQSIPNNRAIHPFRENYGALYTNKVAGDVTIHSPVLTAANAKKVTTLVVDYGVNTAGSAARTWHYRGAFALGNLPYTETIVYPNGFAPNAGAQSLLRNNKLLKNVIWANKPSETEEQKFHMADVVAVEGEVIENLADLRGMGKINAEAMFLDSGLENIVFAGYGAGSHVQTYGGIEALNRVWIDGEGVTYAPASKTVDLSKDTKITAINRQSFSFKSDGYTLKLSDKVTTVTPYAGSYESAFAATFGAELVKVNIEAPNAAFEKSFYEFLTSLASSTYRVYPHNVIVNGKDYRDIREEVCLFEEDELVIYEPLHSDINRDYTYKVTVYQGDKSSTIPVYNHTMFNRPNDRSVGGDNYRRYSAFAFSGAQVRVDIKVGCDFKTYSVFPSAKNFESSFDAATGTISVYLDEPDYFGVRLDDMDNSIISIFADKPQYPDEAAITSKSGNVIYVGPGEWYLPTAGDGKTETTDGNKGVLYITKPDTTVYVAPGGVLYGRVRIVTSATNTSVVGRGAIVDPFADNREFDIRQGGTEGGWSDNGTYKSQFVQSSTNGFYFDGPVLMDARCFHIVVSGQDVEVRNYKAMSSMMTTDGITDSVKAGGVFEHCWLYVGDNALVVSGSTGSYYNDITIGTTCAAIFPQANTRNTLLENLYVFRSNDGIINHRYNPSEYQLVATMTFKNFDCIDIINYPQFLSCSKMGLSPEKVFTFENLSLPYGSGVTDPHSEAAAGDRTRNVLVRLSQGSTYLPTGNYTINFINTYVDGVLLDSQDKATLSVTIPDGAYMDFTFAAQNNGYSPATRDLHTVNYTAPGKVYIGSLQVSFENDVIIEGSTFYLPAEEILTWLRTTKTPATVTKNGMAYIAHTSLKSSGAAADVSVSGGNLKITPVAPSSSTNLIVQNKGVITREFEVTCYHIDLVQQDGVMYAYPHGKQYDGGIGYVITDEVKMYGAGTYKLTLKARCQAQEGGGYTPVKLTYSYDTLAKNDTKSQKSYTLTDSWQEYTLEFTVTSDMIANGIGFAAYIAAYNNVLVEYYAVKDMTVTKIS